jgi:hypothetical protein
VYEDFIKDLVVVQTMLISPRDLLNGFEERMHKPVPLITLEGYAVITVNLRFGSLYGR